MGKISDISNGVVINYRNGLYQIVEFQHVSPGKGSSFVRTRMKHLESGKVIENNFKDGDTVDVVEVNRKNMQLLYVAGDEVTLMDMQSYEQVQIPKSVFGDCAKFLHEGQDVIVVMHEARALSAALPKKISMKVVRAPDAVKGDTSGNVTKEVELENGAIVRAPMFIKEGDIIAVNTETGEYSERTK